jgi:putative FmdB family regulatory protein
MPLYDYRCDECHHEEEVFLHSSNQPPPACPNCGSLHRTKIVKWNEFRPGLQTGTSFFAGAGTLLDQCGGDDREAERIVRAARRKGYNPSPNDLYLPTLAQEPGDPRFFISREGGRDQLKRACDAAGVRCRGLIDYDPPKLNDKEPQKPTKLAERTIRRYMRAAVKQDPTLASKKRELREQIIQRHALHKE